MTSEPAAAQLGGGAKARAIRVLYVHQAVNILCSLMVAPTRIHLLRELRPEATIAQLNGIVTSWVAIIGLSEWLINPTLGKLSDSVGRKPFAMLAPFVNVFVKMHVALRPSVWALGLEQVVGDGLRVVSGATIVNASLSDLISGSELALVNSRMMAVAGVGVMLGPILGRAVIGATGRITSAFAASAAVSGLMLCVSAAPPRW